MKDTITETEITTFPPELIHVAPENPRTDETVDPDRLQELADSIRENGVLSPLIGYQHEGNFFAVVGGRRTRAIKDMHAEGIAPAQIPVRLIDKDDAYLVGATEQITQQALSPLDEMRIYAMPGMSGVKDADFARRLGKSVKAVKQRRAVLSLPSDILDSVFASKITVEQAYGLTYFLDDEVLLAEMYEACLDRPYIDLDDLRHRYKDAFSEWHRHPGSALVTQEDYIANGGRLSADLFSDAKFIETPSVLEKLALEAAEAQVAEDHSDYGFIAMVEYICAAPTHRGLDNLSDEERDEWVQIRWDKYRRDEDEEPDWFARHAELEKKAERYWPDDLKAMLGVHWAMGGSPSTPISISVNVLPDDLEPLYAAGYLDRPEEQAEQAEQAEEAQDTGPAVSAALATRIRSILTYCARQKLASDTQAVLDAFTADKAKDAVSIFSEHRSDCLLPDEKDLGRLAQSKSFIRIEGLASEDFSALKPQQRRDVLAYHLLQRLIPPHTIIDLTISDVLEYVNFDAGFFSAYKKPALIKMIAENSDQTEAAIQNLKKSALEEMAADVLGNKNVLPAGFSLTE